MHRLVVVDDHPIVFHAIRDALLGSLSDREFNVLKGVAEGRSNGEIALELALTPKSVSACRNKLMRKLSMPNVAALIAFARANHVTLD